MPARLRATCERCRAEISAAALSCPLCGAPRAARAGEVRETTDPLIGQILADRWLLRARLGAGASGTIYVGEHATVHKRVAVKILHHDLSRDDLAVERFRREATTVAEIDNEHIIEVYDFGRLPDGRMYFAMELLEGETLAAALRRGGPMPLARAIGILTQVGEALMEAHAMGYVHRDLRPGNVFLDHRRNRDEFVKLFDFGLAKLVERPASDPDTASTSLGMAFGDPRYMSPEQAHGRPADRRADIYSLGAMAYELLTGKPPFAGPSIEILTQHVETMPAAPSTLRAEIPAWLDAVVLRALAKNPDDRFVTVYRFIEALRDGASSGRIMGRTTAQSMPSIQPPAPAPRPRVGAAKTGDDFDPDPDHPASAPLAMAALKAGATPTGAAVDPADLGTSDLEADRASQPDLEKTAADTWFDAPGDSPSWLSSEPGAARDPRPPRRRAPWIFGGLFVLVAAGCAVAYVFWWPARSSSSAPAPSTTQASAGNVAGATAPTAANHLVADAGPVLMSSAQPAAPSRPRPASPREPRAIARTGDPREDTRNRPPVIDFRPPPASAPVAAPAGDSDDDDSDEPAAVAPVPGAPQSSAQAPAAPSPARPGDAAQAEFFVKLGQKSLHDGDTLSAAASFNKAREFDAQSADALAGLGEVALRDGNAAEALVHLDAAARLAPRSARIQTLRGQAYLASKQKPLAAAAFRKALELDPGDATAARGYRDAGGH